MDEVDVVNMLVLKINSVIKEINDTNDTFIQELKMINDDLDKLVAFHQILKYDNDELKNELNELKLDYQDFKNVVSYNLGMNKEYNLKKINK